MKTQGAEDAFAEYWSASYFPALDGLRAVCVALVISFHMKEKTPSLFFGAIGVDIFFVLSGFLITTLLLREKEKYGSVSLKGFYIRRAFRILPIYYLVLLFYFPTVWVLHDAAHWQELKSALPYLLTFTQEFRPLSAGKIYAQTWSLGYEEKYYLVWPLVVLALYALRGRKLIALLAIGVAIFLSPWQASRAYGGLYLGSLLAVLLDRSSRHPLQLYLARVPAWFGVGLAVAAYLLFGLRNLPIQLFSAAITVFVMVLVLRHSVFSRFLAHPWMVLPGKRSYCMYLVHVLVINGVAALARKAHVDVWFVVLPLSFLGSFLLATALFHLVEGPSIEYGRALSRKLRQRLTASAVRDVPAEAAAICPIENPVDV